MADQEKANTYQEDAPVAPVNINEVSDSRKASNLKETPAEAEDVYGSADAAEKYGYVERG